MNNRIGHLLFCGFSGRWILTSLLSDVMDFRISSFFSGIRVSSWSFLDLGLVVFLGFLDFRFLVFRDLGLAFKGYQQRFFIDQVYWSLVFLRKIGSEP